MSRAERLLQLIQALRRRRYPASCADLARELNISLRTLCRDIAALQMRGARIDGERGVALRAAAGLHVAAADVLG
ncbi:HTH domain protein [mine drainage metagenome]|uniref:HTH domain protein n=1 Tax=mine drainage metagenome TaxID=410659 RepID=A0A1J5R5G2_9ZZZZ